MDASSIVTALIAAAAIALIGQAAVLVYVVSRLPSHLDRIERLLIEYVIQRPQP